MSSKSISGELTKKIILAIAILVLGGIFGIIMFSGRVVMESAQKNADSTMKTYTKEIRDIFSEVNPMIAFASWQLEANRNSKDDSYLQTINDKMSHYSDIVAASRITPASKGCDTLEHAFWGEPELIDGIRAVMFSSPVKSESGEYLGRLDITISLDKITKRLDKEHFYKGSYSVIVSPTGTIASHPDTTIVLRNIHELADSRNDAKFKELAEKMTAGESGTGEVRSEKAAAIFGPSGGGWSIAIITPGESLFGDVVRFQLLILLIALGDILVLYIVTRTIISRTLLPITEVTYLAKNVAKGNFKARIPAFPGTNEMHHLHDALRNMLKSINDYIAQLKTTTAANERFESELNVARNIQEQMLCTDFINDKDVDIYAKLKPAKEVGGDMYDFLRSDRSIYFAVGDVSGKGVPAALYMAISRSLFHYVSEMSMSTSNIVSCINSSFCSGNNSNMFITMFVGKLDLDTRELIFCNAGHNPIVIISPDGKAKYIQAKCNVAAGVLDQFPYEKESMMIEKGSRILIYTDGVTEAENAAKDQYGEDRLLAFAGSVSPDTTSEEFVEKLIADVKSFTKDNDQNDDITIMSVRV